MKVKIPYTRFKAWHGGKYYDEDYFEYDLNMNMDENDLYYKMHTEILPSLCEKIGKDFYVVFLDSTFIGWPYIWIPKNVVYIDN